MLYDHTMLQQENIFHTMFIRKHFRSKAIYLINHSFLSIDLYNLFQVKKKNTNIDETLTIKCKTEQNCHGLETKVEYHFKNIIKFLGSSSVYDYQFAYFQP